MFRTAMMSVLTLGVLAVGLPAVAGEDEKKDVARSFVELSDYLNVGDTVFVTDRRGEKVKARVEELGPTRIHVSRDGSALVLAENDVLEMDVQHSDSLKNGALIGAGVGLGASLLLSGATREEGEELTGGQIAGFAMVIGLGTAAGVGIDALHKGRRLVYSSPVGSPGTRVSIYPILTRTRRGVGVSVSF